MSQALSGQQIGVDRAHLAHGELVTTPNRISAILDDIHRHLVLIGVRMDPDGPLYESVLIRLDTARTRLSLDLSGPVEDHARLGPGQRIHLHVSLRGIAIRFSITIDEVPIEDGRPLYVGQYPTEISFLQRRGIFRVHLPLHDRRRVRLQHKESENAFSAQIIDLSVKGFCVELNETDIDRTQLGSRFEYIGMKLPDLRSTLSGEAVLVNLRPSPRPGALSAGFVIANLDPQVERSLMRAALYYQREARRAGI
ncbi:flagellar brake protein [Thiocystis violascens]|uniref:Putative glycosyltransferase n=1 Tax=Thiocystis violascens (strain ATCC 17096 / DSM 198 / 6111) TaxID=765911 RepID=I3Y639_THIV6|nr:flagellar brake protein [Thiocystis violascens]AFL72457.1 putative glycosyltransferase [Thiocystis violascens DSM 198]